MAAAQEEHKEDTVDQELTELVQRMGNLPAPLANLIAGQDTNTLNYSTPGPDGNRLQQ